MSLGDTALRHVPVHVVRAMIADAVLAAEDVPARLGSVTLWDHQREAVARLRMSIREFGGALLADEVGLGKTYVALTLASTYASPIVIAPAALRSTWSRAFEATGRSLPWISLESLSYRVPECAPPDLVVVDEAHHARTPATKRYRALAELAEHSHILLMSATPIHNARRDLLALLALFLGAHACAIDDAALARLIVRRTHETMQGAAALPRVRQAVSIPTVDDLAVAQSIVALPPPVPPEDGGAADALVTFTLVRQWSSSVGALRGALRRRIGRARALLDTLHTGRLPSRAELDAWVVGDDAQQLAFSELLGPATRLSAAEPSAATTFLKTAETHERALVALEESLSDAADRARAAALEAVLAAHVGARILAFSQFADTVAAYWRSLRNVPGVCALTAGGARVAGGRISRADAIDRFAPAANGARPPSRAHEIRLLLTTDILSEGVNLQDASVVVHLDLPWTAARIEQRVGRVARAGSLHRMVSVYTIAPPASSEAIVAIERRLREKIAAAAVAVGAPAANVAAIACFAAPVPPPAASEMLRTLMKRWERAPSTASFDGVPCAAVRASESGWLALLRSDRGARIVAALGERIGVDAAMTHCVAMLASGDDVEPVTDGPTASAVDAALTSLQGWRAAERAAILAGVPEIAPMVQRRAVLARLAGQDGMPRLQRVANRQFAVDARRVASGRMTAGQERALLEAGARPHDAHWLPRIALLSQPAQEGATLPVDSGERLAALLVLVR